MSKKVSSDQNIAIDQIITTAKNLLDKIPPKQSMWPNDIFTNAEMLIKQRREFLVNKNQFKQAVDLYKEIKVVLQRATGAKNVSKLKKLLASERFTQLYDLDELECKIQKDKAKQDDDKQGEKDEQKQLIEQNININEIDLKDPQLLIPNSKNTSHDLQFIYKLFGINYASESTEVVEDIHIYSPLQTIQQNPSDMEDLRVILLKSHDQEARCQVVLKFMSSKALTYTDVSYEYLLALLMREFNNNPELMNKQIYKGKNSLADELDEIITTYISKFYIGVLSLPFVIYSITKQNTSLIQAQIKQLSLLGFYQDDYDLEAELPRCVFKKETVDGETEETLEQIQEEQLLSIFPLEIQDNINNFINLPLDQMADQLYSLETTDDIYTKLYHIICIIKSTQSNIKTLYEKIKVDFDKLSENDKRTSQLEKKQKEIEQLINTSKLLYALSILEQENKLQKAGRTIYDLLKKCQLKLDDQICKEYFTKVGDLHFVCVFITFLYFIVLSLDDELVDESIDFYNNIILEEKQHQDILSIMNDIVNHNYNENTDILLRTYCEDIHISRLPKYVQNELDEHLIGSVVPDEWLKSEL